MTAYVGFASEMVAFETCVRKPETAAVPDNPAVMCMMVYNAVARVDDKTLKPFMQYICRTPKEAQALFATSVVRQQAKIQFVTRNAEFTNWARDNFGLFQKM